MSSDWHFEVDNTVCSFRAVGILIDKDMVLVQSDNGEDEVKNLNIYPHFIKDKITDIGEGIEHFIHRD